MFNIAKKKKKNKGWETFWDSVKFTWDSTFVDALGPRDAIEIKPKSNTDQIYAEGTQNNLLIVMDKKLSTSDQNFTSNFFFSC